MSALVDGEERRLPRVVFVLPAYLPESYGGAEQQTRRISQVLARAGAQVTLIAPRLKRGTPVMESEGPVVVRRFALRAWPNLGGWHLDSFVLWCAWVAAWLWWHRRDYDVIHVIHGRLHAVPAVVAGRALGKPVVIKLGRGGEEHFDLDVVRRKRIFGRYFANRIARGTAAWVANSAEIVNDLRRWRVPMERVVTIPNGIALPEPTSRAVDEEPIRFVAMGRLDPEKAFDQMIEGFAMLGDHVPVELTILGDGQCRDQLASLVRRFGQEHRIVFAGAVDDVLPFLRRAHFYVSTSLSEGMSNALLEAMSAGCVPIVSRVSGVPELVDDGRSGSIFSPGDRDAFVAKLEAAIRMSPQERVAFGEAARATIQERFSLDFVLGRQIALYEKLIGSIPCRGSI